MMTWIVACLTIGAMQDGAPIKAQLTWKPYGVKQAQITVSGKRVTLTAENRLNLKSIPAGPGKVQFGTVEVGVPSKSIGFVLIETAEPVGATLIVDVNGNGDLGDDTPSAAKIETIGTTQRLTFPAFTLTTSWGGETVPFSLSMYCFPRQSAIYVQPQSARVGSVMWKGKSVPMMLVELDANGIFRKPVETKEDGSPEKPITSRPVTLYLDLNGDGQFKSTREQREQWDVRGPFEIDGLRLEADVSVDGSSLTLRPTQRAVFQPISREQIARVLTALRKPNDPNNPAPARPALLTAGTPAPDFTVEKFGGGVTKLSDFRGKVVVLDFWATWCGPCMKSMPHLQKVGQALKGQPVEVLAVCVSDTRDKYNTWVESNKTKYTFRFAMDPAERDGTKAIHRNLFNVSGIPTTYIIDKDGKVIEAIVGYRDGDTRLEAALRKSGIKVEDMVALK